MITVDELAQEIRRVDGNHKLGAGALAEALMPFLERSLSASPAGVKPRPLSDKLRYEADGMFAATQGEDYGDTLHLHNWHDKPNRVVYDAVDLLRQAADEIDTLSTRIMSALEPAGVGVETLTESQVQAIDRLDSTLCSFLNGAQDEFDPRLWIPETKRNFEALCESYNQCHVEKVMDLRRAALSKEGEQ